MIATPMAGDVQAIVEPLGGQNSAYCLLSGLLARKTLESVFFLMGYFYYVLYIIYFKFIITIRCQIEKIVTNWVRLISYRMRNELDHR